MPVHPTRVSFRDLEGRMTKWHLWMRLSPSCREVQDWPPAPKRGGYSKRAATANGRLQQTGGYSKDHLSGTRIEVYVIKSSPQANVRYRNLSSTQAVSCCTSGGGVVTPNRVLLVFSMSSSARQANNPLSEVIELSTTVLRALKAVKTHLS